MSRGPEQSLDRAFQDAKLRFEQLSLIHRLINDCFDSLARVRNNHEILEAIEREIIVLRNEWDLLLKEFLIAHTAFMGLINYSNALEFRRPLR